MSHEPSFYRSLIREKNKKNGRHPSILIADAKKMNDEYYSSLALMRLSDDKRISIHDAVHYAFESIRMSQGVDRFWRRGELLSLLAKYAKNWRGSSSEKEQNKLLDDISKEIKKIPKGNELSQTIDSSCKYVGCSRMEDMLHLAISNTDFLDVDTRTVLRHWAGKCHDQISWEKIYSILLNVDNSAIRSKLMMYLYLQCSRLSISCDKVFSQSIDDAMGLEDDDKILAFDYIAKHISYIEDFMKMKQVLDKISNSFLKTKLASTLGGFADKNGFKDISLDFFMRGLEESGSIQDNKEKIKTEIKIINGLMKLNEKQIAFDLLNNLQKTDDDTINKLIEKNQKRYNQIKNDSLLETMYEKDIKIQKGDLPTSTGCVLALYDTYEGSLKPIHLRMISRAAPLCTAFGLDLALIGFPIDDESEFFKKLAVDTTIGKNGIYLQFLADEKRIQVISSLKEVMSSPLDIAVATTANPEENKKISMDAAVGLLDSNKKTRVFIFMGLGKKGLPDSLLKRVSHHVELTDVNISLETSTAMGIIAFQLYLALKKQK
ncbi:MAG: hypothetical protein DRN27_06835 [Thermoplasmata archaeon]|nr:MAG: hypothetical protein DRN27_06835 [Thermoplasmata archaeon]